MDFEVSSAQAEPALLTEENFLNDFKEPTVLKNYLLSWDSVPWTLTELSEKYGTLLLDFRVVPRKSDRQGPVWEGDAQFVNATISQFVEWLEILKEDENSKNPLAEYPSTEFWLYSSYNYMFQIFPEDSAILKGVDWKPLGFEGRSGKDSTFWIGSSGAYTPCHSDTYGCNLVAQICGRKQWILFSPEDRDSLYPTRIPYEESSVFSSVNILNPDLKSHPLFEKCHPYIVTLEPGDVLFVPKQWWHFVRCLDASVSINTWIELPKDSDVPTRLEEAVTRVLTTSLISTYEPPYETWLNPNEALVSPEETLNYVLTNLNLLKEKDEKKLSQTSSIVEDFNQSIILQKPHKVAKFDGSSDARSSKNLKHNVGGNLGVSLIQSSNFLELMKVLGVTDGSSDDIPHSSDIITPKDIINCILHPEVISLISEKLKCLSNKSELCSAEIVSKPQGCA